MTRRALRRLLHAVRPDHPGTDRLINDLNKAAAPDWTSGAAEPNGWKEPKDMSIIPRHARELHAGDIIIRDPDHGGRPVRWRVSAKPNLTGDGVAIIDYVDISDEPKQGIAHFDALVSLSVEPVGERQDGAR